MSERAADTAPEVGPSAARRLPVEGGLLMLVALLCLGFQLRLPGKLTDERDYQAVAAVLAQERQAGDVVLLSPWWTERARLHVPDGLPVVGYQGSDSDPLERHPRIWVLAQPELPRSNVGALMQAFGPSRTEVGQERRFGNLSLRLFTNGRARPVRFSLEAALAGAQVYLEGADGQRQPCAWDGRRHRCGNGAEVLAEWHEIAFAPHRCVRLMPPGGQTRLVVEVAGVPAAETLSLQAGYTWDRGYIMSGVTDAELALEVNGARSALPMPRGTVGLQRLDARGTPEGATVRVSSSAASPSYRELCVELYAFGGAR